jgi:hypothetical protein
VALTVAQHVTNTRRLSNSENNAGFVSDNEITRRLNEGTSELYDLIVVAFEHYFVSSLLFTLAGGQAGYTQALPADFYKDVGLDRNPGTTAAVRVPKLPSFMERNRASGPVYAITGNNLEVRPPDNSAGPYQLFYTPKAPVLAAPVVVTHNAADAVVAATGHWTFTNGAFDSTYVGAAMTIAGAANAGNNGTFIITAVISATVVVTAITGLVNETFGGGVTDSFQLANTSNTLDVTLSNWEEFIDVRAAIKVLTKREMDTTSLQSDLLALTQRIKAMAANRSEEPSQVPLADGYGSAWWNAGEDGR